MSRSVSVHPNTVSTVYLYPEIDEDGWDDFIQDLRDNVLIPRFPSLRHCDRWAGREDHVILENTHAEVSVSEYNGLVAVCLAPCSDGGRETPLGTAWTHQVADRFRDCVQGAFKSSALVKQGVFSNGEAVFALRSQPGSCVTSKEGQLW
jgi:hypothetical protein